MKKLILYAIAFTALNFAASAQKFFTNKATAQFYSSTPMEDIKGVSTTSSALLNAADQSVVFVIENKKFQFAKPLMQDHFNENYMESDKYPKSTFTGKYDTKIDPAKNGKYNVTVSGNLTIHGVTKKISVPATIEMRNGMVVGHTQFFVKTKDYNIKVPSLVVTKIAEDIQVTIDFAAEKL